MSINNT